ELAVLDPEDERVPLGLGEVEPFAVGVGRVVHHVQPGLIGLVRGGRGVGGDVHLDPALLGIDRARVEWPRVGWHYVVTRSMHALRLPSLSGGFEPTSQVCSACGDKDGPKPLRVREWTCPRCGTTHDRDVNAAVNIARAAGLAVTA